MINKKNSIIVKTNLSLFQKEWKVINNEIDLDKFKPIKSNFKEKNDLKDKFLILGVASVWERRKEINCFFKLSKNWILIKELY